MNAHGRRKLDRALGRWLAVPTYRHLVALRGFDGFHAMRGGPASWAARCYLRPEIDVYVREQARTRRRLGVL